MESQDFSYLLPRYKPQNTYAHLLVLLPIVDSHQERFKCSHTLFSRVGMSRGTRCALVGDFIIVHSSHITQMYMAWVSCAVRTHHVPRTWWGVWICCQHNCSVLNFSFVSPCILLCEHGNQRWPVDDDSCWVFMLPVTLWAVYSCITDNALALFVRPASRLTPMTYTTTSR